MYYIQVLLLLFPVFSGIIQAGGEGNVTELLQMLRCTSSGEVPERLAPAPIRIHPIGVYTRGASWKAASWKLKGELHNVDNRSWNCNSWIDEHGIRWNSGGACSNSTRSGAHGARGVERGPSRAQAQ